MGAAITQGGGVCDGCGDHTRRRSTCSAWKWEFFCFSHPLSKKPVRASAGSGLDLWGLSLQTRGGSRIFIGGGGGGANDLCAHTHIMNAKPRVPYNGGPLKLSAGFDALSCYLSPIVKHSDTKWEKRRSNFRGGGGVAPIAPPSKSATAHTL